jgi:electron transport complex protein RnfE
MSNEMIKENQYLKIFSKGIFDENPILVLLLGLCPTLAVTSMVSNGLGMGLAATFVLLGSNILVSLLKNFIPAKVRIPAYIVIIASFVTIVEMILNAYLPPLADALGIFIPLIVVNCIILGRAEAFASKNTLVNSIFDALGIGLGFTLALVVISLVREIFGTVQIDFSQYYGPALAKIPGMESGVISAKMFGNDLEIYSGATIFIAPAGAFFVLGLLIAVMNQFKYSRATKEDQLKEIATMSDLTGESGQKDKEPNQ